MTMSSHEFEESVSDSRQRWEDDGGSIPPDHSNPTRTVLKLGKRKAVTNSDPATRKPSIGRLRRGLK
jgi:hypothetical protein